MFAAREGYREVISVLLGKGAQPNLQNKDGWTALQIAASLGYHAIVTQLLRHGADLNLEDKVSLFSYPL
jgi:uncharacterized protein